MEETICSDPELAALDRKLDEVYRTAMERLPADEAPTQRAMQRGWIGGRNECWKADDLVACVAEEYRRRTVELQIISGKLLVPEPVGYSCAGQEGMPFFATFYQDTDPPSAVITRGDDQVIAFRVPSGSGAKYAAANEELWEHHGEAAVDCFGTELTCKARN